MIISHKNANIWSVFLLALTCFALSFCSKDKDDEDSLDRTLIPKDFPLMKDFTGVKVDRAIKLKLVPSETYKVNIKVSAYLARYLKVSKDGSVLVIDLDLTGSDFDRIGTDEFSGEIHMPVLNTVEAKGASKISFASEFKSSANMMVVLDGASELENAKINGEKYNLTLNASGASKVGISGKVKDIDLKLLGASKVSGKDLVVSGTSDIDLSGASTSVLTLNGDIKAKLAGASKLTIYGSGKITTQDVTGDSTLEKK